MIDTNARLFELQAEICKTLSQPKRLMIVHELRAGRRSVGELVTILGISQSNVSQHLSRLRKHGIVETLREGTTVYYSLASPKIGEACDIVRGLLEEQLKQGENLVKSLNLH